MRVGIHETTEAYGGPCPRGHNTEWDRLQCYWLAKTCDCYLRDKQLDAEEAKAAAAFQKMLPIIIKRKY